LFGIGINNFAVYYQFQTGRADFGPHSFYVATLTELGIVGALVWLLFLVWVGSRLRVLLRAGRARSSLGDDDGVLSAVARGLAAGFVATLVGNIFYPALDHCGPCSLRDRTGSGAPRGSCPRHARDLTTTLRG
jgi:O-antigen ligase